MAAEPAAMATADKGKLATLCEDTAAHRYFEGGNERMFGSIMGTVAPALGSMRQLARVEGSPFSVRSWMRKARARSGCPNLPVDPGVTWSDLLLSHRRWNGESEKNL